MNGITLALPLPASVPAPVSLDAYIQAVQRFPLLREEEERELALRLREHGDRDAARQLVLSHLRFVVKMARGYMGYGLPLADLIQEGNVGLMKAVKRFDPNVGVRLVSFAVYWIRAEIHQFVLRNWRIVKVATTKAQRKLFFKLRSHWQQLKRLRRDDARRIARELGVSMEDVLEMEQRLGAHDVAFDGPPGDSNEEQGMTPALALTNCLLVDPEEALVRQQEADRSQALLRRGIENLDDRSRDIVRRRWLNEPKTSLQQLAKKYGVSAERIRQIEATAMNKLKATMEAAT